MFNAAEMKKIANEQGFAKDFAVVQSKIEIAAKNGKFTTKITRSDFDPDYDLWGNVDSFADELEKLGFDYAIYADFTNWVTLAVSWKN